MAKSSRSETNTFVVMCYGDSNTFGRKPGRKSLRFDEGVRWTCRLERQLNTDPSRKIRVTNEGVNGRYIDMENPDVESVAKFGSRNGWNDFRTTLENDVPDFVIVMLGTNEQRAAVAKTAEEIAVSLEKYADLARDFQVNTLFIPPPQIDVAKAEARSWGLGFSRKSILDHDELAQAIEKMSHKKCVQFFDATKNLVVGSDGIHLTAESNAEIATRIARYFEKIVLK